MKNTKDTTTNIHTKAFLNLDGYQSAANILVALSPKSLEIEITDCNDRVKLRQTMIDEGDVENALFKVNVLIATLSLLVEPLKEIQNKLRKTKKN